MGRPIHQALAVLVYWAATFWWLRTTSPVYMDGGGPMPSFYWGETLLPGLGEYYARQSYYDWHYALPYLVVGLIAAVLSCTVAPVLYERGWARSSNVFVGNALLAVALLAIAALASDLGGILGWWSGPMFFLGGILDFYSVFWLSRLFLVLGLLAGAQAVALRRLSRFSVGTRVIGA